MMKKPIRNRFLGVWLLGFCCLSSLLAEKSEAPFTEAQVLAEALSRESLRTWLEAEVDQTRADALATRIWKNPVFSFTFEQAKGSGMGSDEGIFFFQQQIEPKSRRRKRSEAAEARVLGAKERAEWIRVQVEGQARKLFYSLLQAKARGDAAKDWGTRLVRVREIVRLRHLAGDASRYDLQRVDREKAEVEAAKSTADAERLAQIEELLGLAPGLIESGSNSEAELDLQGELFPRTEVASLEVYLKRLESRPDLKGLHQEARASRLESEVAKSFRIPYFNLGVGAKVVHDSAGDMNGPVAFASVPLPILDRQLAPRKKAEARIRSARGRAVLRLQEEQGVLRGAYRRAEKLLKSAQAFHSAALGPSEALRQTAEAAYEAGEVGVLSLLDAYRSAYQARIQWLDLAGRARTARIELDRLAGGLK